MKNKSIYFISITFLMLFCSSCNNSITTNDEYNSSWIFIANEGNMGDSDGSISMINDYGNMIEIENVGDVVQSLEVHDDKLIVLVNNSHLVKIYTITEKGLLFPGMCSDHICNTTNPKIKNGNK